MATTAENLADPKLLQTEWDLEPLVYGEGEAGVDRLLSETTERASAFAERYAGKLEKIEQIEIRWPSGIVQVLRNVVANQILEVHEPSK